MGPEQLETMWQTLSAGPVTPQQAQVWADALEEVGHPFAAYARGRQECREEDLPKELADWLLGGRRGLTERLVFEDGVLRGVRFRSSETPWEGLEAFLAHEGERAGELVDELVLHFDVEQSSMEVVGLLTSEACRSVTEVSGLTLVTFKLLTEADLDLRAVSVIQDRSEEEDSRFSWCGTGFDADPPPVRRLRVTEVTEEMGPGNPGESLRWLLSSSPEVFHRLERLSAPGASSACVEALTRYWAGPLRHLDAGEWSATRDEQGWHLVVGLPADGRRLYEDLVLELALDSWPRLIASLAEVVVDVVFRGPRMPLGELPALEAAAGGKPIRFELGHPDEAATRAARGLPERRFDVDAPLLDRELPF